MIKLGLAENKKKKNVRVIIQYGPSIPSCLLAPSSTAANPIRPIGHPVCDTIENYRHPPRS